MRDHSPVNLEEFNGLWDRGDVEEVPLDHFSECNNIQFYGSSAFATRDGLGPHQTVVAPVGSVLRMYNYPTTDKNTLLVLIKNGSNGEIYHIVDAATIFGPILTIANMFDFAFTPYAGRAYISPFITELVGALNRERGMQNEFLYVYKGDGTAARKAAGVGPVTGITVANGGAGYTDPGLHIFGYVYEYDTGYLSPPAGLTTLTTNALNAVDFSTVSVGGANVTKRHIVASRAIPNYNGNTKGYTLYFVPGADIPNNVGTTLSNISFYDADLLLDASHLLDNFSEIKAGVGLTTYHNRLCIWTEYDNISIIRVSAPGEPEAISQIEGLILVPQDGNPITNAAELRDVLYVMKRSKTLSYADNGGPPTSWQSSNVDPSFGTGVHGIATVIDSGTSTVDYLLVATYLGLTLFNGRYIIPELSWKIASKWKKQAFKTDFRRIQAVIDTTNQLLWCVLTDRSVLFADFKNGFDPKKIRWSPWTFDAKVNSLALVNINDLLIGCDIT